MSDQQGPQDNQLEPQRDREAILRTLVGIVDILDASALTALHITHLPPLEKSGYRSYSVGIHNAFVTSLV
jgi:hypothetical protein